MNRPAVLLIYDRTTLRRIWMISQEAFCSNRSSLVIFCAHFPGGNDGIPMAISQTHLYRAGSKPTIPEASGQRPQKSQRYRIYPHINGIADQSELRITACAEYPGDQGCVYRRTHNIIGIDKQHVLQIMHCPVT